MTVAMNQIMFSESEATKLLDFNQKFDISLLERVVISLYQGQGEQVKLWLFQEHELLQMNFACQFFENCHISKPENKGASYLAGLFNQTCRTC